MSLLCVCAWFLCLSPSLFPHSCVSPSPGAIQSFAGFADYFTAMAQEGWFPLLCVGLRPQWEDHHLQDLQDSYGQEWVSSARHHPLPASSCPVPCTFVGIVQPVSWTPAPHSRTSVVAVGRKLSLTILGSTFCFPGSQQRWPSCCRQTTLSQAHPVFCHFPRNVIHTEFWCVAPISLKASRAVRPAVASCV